MMEMKVRPQCQVTSSVLRVIKFLSCLTQLSIKFIKLINVKINKIVGISENICKIFQHLSLKARKVFILKILIFYKQLKFHAQLSTDRKKKFYIFEARFQLTTPFLG